MELREQRVRNSFENYVLALQNPAKPILTKEFLEPFLCILIPGIKQLPKGANPQFPIPLNEVAALYHMAPSKFARILQGRPERASSGPTHEFHLNEDYIIEGKKPNVSLFMTHSCFARASMLLRKGRGMQVRQYFNLVDRALRDKMGEGLWSRLQIENPEVTKEKEERVEYKTGAYGQPGNYDYGLRFGNRDFKYHGITDDENTRFQSHKYDQHGKVHDWTWKPDPFPRFKEACRDRYFSTEKIAIPDFMRGFKGMYENNEQQWTKIDKFCDDLTLKADKEYMLTLHKSAGHDPRTGVVLDAPGEYPTARIETETKEAQTFMG